MVRYLYLRVAGALVLIGCLFLGPTVAWAHEQVDSGSYHFEIGWVNEPVLVGERNGLDLFVAAKDSPETGLSDLESNLTFGVEYGSARQEYDVVPVEDNPGHYTAAFVPTREGQYTFHLTGTIQDEAVDVKVEPEEVVAAGQLAFPEALPSAAELAAKLDGAQAQAGTAQTIAIVGAALGLIGAGLGAFGLLRKK
jgi:hypothetical protein